MGGRWWALGWVLAMATWASGELRLNEQQYFYRPGLSVLVFHDVYPEGKQGGIEIIQHDQRTAAVGDVRIEPIPWQWSPLPRVGARTVDAKSNRAAVGLEYPELKYTVWVRGEGDAVRVGVDLEKPLAPKWVGKAGFQLELFPVAYFGKSYRLGDVFGVFPRQANGPMTSGKDKVSQPVPLAKGKKLLAAPEDPLVRLDIEAVKGELELYDGREADQTGWFVVRSTLPAGTTAGAVEWIIKPHVIAGYVRPPVIAHSQVGYHPDQAKQAVIELDPQTKKLDRAVLRRIEPDGSVRDVLAGEPRRWGRFLRYDYAIFDFTAIKDPGVYRVAYGKEISSPFRIACDVYQQGVWQPTLETFFPVQMCHMRIRDRFKVWHGACHLDDALQAPPGHVHFDGFLQHATTDTPFKPYEHIPHLDRGGWHDAGDYDLAAGSQASTVYTLILARETFGVDTDQTTVLPNDRLTVLHRPDGVPDIVQQIEHGVHNLLSGYRAAGHSFCGIIEPVLQEYLHFGDGASITDNRVHQPGQPIEPLAGEHYGRRDDRLAFTNRDTSMEYRCVQVLSAASRVLKGYNDALARECLETAVKTWTFEQTHPPASCAGAYIPGSPEQQEFAATVELFLTTRDEIYRKHLVKLLPKFDLAGQSWNLGRVLTLLKDDALKARLRQAAEKSAKALKTQLEANPFGVPFYIATWGCGWGIQDFAVGQYFLIRAFPDLYDREQVLKVVNYVLGCHPGSSVSLVSGVGAKSLTTAYGSNRGDWFYIPGGMASGAAVILPDFPELRDNFPFLWQQAEYVMPGAASYLFCVLAADDLLNRP